MTVPTHDDVWALSEAVRGRNPLVQNITNFVAMTISANVLLAAGASPAMVHAREEAEDFLAIAAALVVNIGTLSPEWVASMEACGRAATAAGKPWVLDPVGCGATPYRTGVARALAELRPSIIRGNASEILSLAGAAGAGKGVDSRDASDAAIAAGRELSSLTGATVAITGATDYVVDAGRVVAIDGGDALMPLSTAIGCALSALCGAYATQADPFEAAVAALAVYAAAGARAARRAEGPGDLPAHLCNALHGFSRDDLAAVTLRPAGEARA